jgi:hypothetical protein
MFEIGARLKSSRSTSGTLRASSASCRGLSPLFPSWFCVVHLSVCLHSPSSCSLGSAAVAINSMSLSVYTPRTSGVTRADACQSRAADCESCARFTLISFSASLSSQATHDSILNLDVLSPVYHCLAPSSSRLAGRMHLMAMLTAPQTFHKAWPVSL